MSAPGGPRWGLTLFSFTNELLAASTTPDEMLERLLRSGSTPTVEIDGAQHFRSFPLLDPGEVGITGRLVADNGGAVSVLGGGADLTPAPGVLLEADAVLEQLGSQIRAARILGAEALRLPFGVLSWPVLRRAADMARDEGVLLLEEVQGPLTPRAPRLAERLGQLSATGETAVRLLLDMSALMEGLPPTYLRALRAEGLGGDALDRLAAACADHRVAAEVLPRLADPDLSAAARGLLVTAMTRFGHGTARDWLPLAPWIAGIHLKWWDLESAAADLDGEAGALLDGLFAAGFAGTVCSEWGGHEWETSAIDAASQAVAHRSLFDDRFPGVLAPQPFRAEPAHFSTKAT